MKKQVEYIEDLIECAYVGLDRRERLGEVAGQIMFDVAEVCYEALLPTEIQTKRDCVEALVKLRDKIHAETQKKKKEWKKKVRERKKGECKAGRRSREELKMIKEMGSKDG